MNNKLKKLKEYLQSLGSCAIAFSGGVDSSLLLAVAKDVLGDRCIAITMNSSLIPRTELKEARTFCEKLKIKHFVLDVDELETPGFKENPPNRCYLCKHNIFSKIIARAKNEGVDYVCEGSNVDDEGDYRPGIKAIAELDVKSPLRSVRLTKEEIRALSKEYKLDTWKKPSYACLASRIPYGEIITREKLGLIEKAEQYLHEIGFEQIRVRVHGNLAHLEFTENDYEKIYDKNLRSEISARLKEIGFTFVTVDLMPYKTGSMNTVLEKKR